MQSQMFCALFYRNLPNYVDVCIQLWTLVRTMSDHRYRNKHRSLWPPRRVSTRLSTSQGSHFDRTHHYDNTSVVVSSSAMDIPPDTVIVHVPGVPMASRTPTSERHNGKCNSDKGVRVFRGLYVRLGHLF